MFNISRTEPKKQDPASSGHWELSANEMVRWWVEDSDQAIYPLTPVGGDDPPGHYSPGERTPDDQ